MSIFVLHCFGYHYEFTRFLFAKTKRVRRFFGKFWSFQTFAVAKVIHFFDICKKNV